MGLRTYIYILHYRLWCIIIHIIIKVYRFGFYTVYAGAALNVLFLLSISVILLLLLLFPPNGKHMYIVMPGYSTRLRFDCRVRQRRLPEKLRTRF